MFQRSSAHWGRNDKAAYPPVEELEGDLAALYVGYYSVRDHSSLSKKNPLENIRSQSMIYHSSLRTACTAYDQYVAWKPYF